MFVMRKSSSPEPAKRHQSTDDTTGADGMLAADLIRDKVSRLYEDEPSALQEAAEAETIERRSPHQQFMHELSNSGKDLATVQTEWHNYYQSLSAAEKHQVWQEFYASQSNITKPEVPQTLAEHKQQAAKPERKPRKLRDVRSTKDVQTAIRDSVTAGGKLETRHHLQSLLFGLGMGLVVVIIFLFGFFNEVVIAPFIQPSRAHADTPLIVNSNSVAPTSTPEVIIPKINVQIPVNYDDNSTNEADIENDLENGVVHYPTTALPGQQGNAAYFGHSSNNIFNKGKYKFAFVMLRTLVPGDTFYLTYGGKVYAYEVITKTVVDPSEVGVLGPVEGQTATATLITCDPPGTSLKRLVVVGKQISPDPSGNTAAAAVSVTKSSPPALPGNGQTLWGRFIGSPTGKATVVVVLVGGGALVLRQTHRKILS